MATTSRRNLLTIAAGTVAATGALGTLPGLGAVVAPDPVFAAIEHERQLDVRWMALQDEVEAGRKDLKGEMRTALAAHGDEVRRVMAIRPTITAGLIALIERFEELTEGSWVEPDEHGLTPLLASILSHLAGQAGRETV